MPDALIDSGIYRSGAAMRELLARIADIMPPHRELRLMEVCGGQTFTLSRYRLEELLPPGLSMVHGPGCPVCVTPAEVVDDAVRLAMTPGVTLCSFGDMLRVPGRSCGSLLRARSRGADLRILYSPVEALNLAVANPDRQVVFFAIGFETTAPAYAVIAERAVQCGITNFTMLTHLVTVPAAVRAVLSEPDSNVDALLAAGHVCAVTGTAPYHLLSRELGIPVVITGFEPTDLLLGIHEAVSQLAAGQARCTNMYGRVVAPEGNPRARQSVERVFRPATVSWRGFGQLPDSGMELRPEFEQIDARRRFSIAREVCPPCNDGCIAARIMKGRALPSDCPHFATGCTPLTPKGAPMVSSEGVCAAHFRYRPANVSTIN